MKTTVMKTRNKTYDLVITAMFAVLIALCSWISVPSAVPFTLQTFGVFAAVGILGGKRGTAAVLIYILMGAVGIPVFAGFSGGIGILAGSTGGYVVGFLGLALVMWGAERMFGRKFWVLLVSMVLGLIVCYAFGTAWYMAVYLKETGAVSLGAVLMGCVVPFIIPDLIKIALALALSRRFYRYVQ